MPAERGRRSLMQITDVRVRKVTKEGKMKAVVSITLDDEFAVHDIKIIEGEKGLFIAMPSRKTTDGEYRDIAHPINSETRDRIQKIILEKYGEVVDQDEEERLVIPITACIIIGRNRILHRSEYGQENRENQKAPGSDCQVLSVEMRTGAERGKNEASI